MKKGSFNGDAVATFARVEVHVCSKYKAIYDHCLLDFIKKKEKGKKMQKQKKKNIKLRLIQSERGKEHSRLN